mmetsp:Transcript_74002/g.194110  ORF Transcript_74002/g.194110 Transcript_74002/m.194110 type:complete len:319 (+) Transcript_74002:329-1285(+)
MEAGERRPGGSSAPSWSSSPSLSPQAACRCRTRWTRREWWQTSRQTQAEEALAPGASRPTAPPRRRPRARPSPTAAGAGPARGASGSRGQPPRMTAECLAGCQHKPCPARPQVLPAQAIRRSTGSGRPLHHRIRESTCSRRSACTSWAPRPSRACPRPPKTCRSTARPPSRSAAAPAPRGPCRRSGPPRCSGAPARGTRRRRRTGRETPPRSAATIRRRSLQLRGAAQDEQLLIRRAASVSVRREVFVTPSRSYIQCHSVPTISLGVAIDRSPGLRVPVLALGDAIDTCLWPRCYKRARRATCEKPASTSYPGQCGAR